MCAAKALASVVPVYEYHSFVRFVERIVLSYSDFLSIQLAFAHVKRYMLVSYFWFPNMTLSAYSPPYSMASKLS